jgi:hypothetical protein
MEERKGRREEEGKRKYVGGEEGRKKESGERGRERREEEGKWGERKGGKKEEGRDYELQTSLHSLVHKRPLARKPLEQAQEKDPRVLLQSWAHPPF